MNQGLVKGAALVGRSKQSNWAEAMQQGLNSSLQAAAINRSKQIAKKQKINSTVAGYIDSLNSEIDLTQLTGEQQGAITNFLVENKNTYARAASEIAKIDDATDPRYMELREQMNGVQNSFKNLAGQVNAFKEDKVSYLKDFDDRRISDGNEIGPLASAARIYTDQGNIGVGKGGNLNFWDADKEEYTNYANVQKPFLKDFKSANNILSLNKRTEVLIEPLVNDINIKTSPDNKIDINIPIHNLVAVVIPKMLLVGTMLKNSLLQK